MWASEGCSGTGKCGVQKQDRRFKRPRQENFSGYYDGQRVVLMKMPWDLRQFNNRKGTVQSVSEPKVQIMLDGWHKFDLPPVFVDPHFLRPDYRQYEWFKRGGDCVALMPNYLPEGELEKRKNMLALQQENFEERKKQVARASEDAASFLQLRGTNVVHDPDEQNPSPSKSSTEKMPGSRASSFSEGVQQHKLIGPRNRYDFDDVKDFGSFGPGMGGGGDPPFQQLLREEEQNMATKVAGPSQVEVVHNEHLLQRISNLVSLPPANKQWAEISHPQKSQLFSLPDKYLRGELGIMVELLRSKFNKLLIEQVENSSFGNLKYSSVYPFKALPTYSSIDCRISDGLFVQAAPDDRKVLQELINMIVSKLEILKTKIHFVLGTKQSLSKFRIPNFVLENVQQVQKDILEFLQHKMQKKLDGEYVMPIDISAMRSSLGMGGTIVKMAGYLEGELGKVIQKVRREFDWRLIAAVANVKEVDFGGATHSTNDVHFFNVNSQDETICAVLDHVLVEAAPDQVERLDELILHVSRAIDNYAHQDLSTAGYFEQLDILKKMRTILTKKRQVLTFATGETVFYNEEIENEQKNEHTIQPTRVTGVTVAGEPGLRNVMVQRNVYWLPTVPRTSLRKLGRYEIKKEGESITHLGAIIASDYSTLSSHQDSNLILESVQTKFDSDANGIRDLLVAIGDFLVRQRREVARNEEAKEEEVEGKSWELVSWDQFDGQCDQDGGQVDGHFTPSRTVTPPRIGTPPPSGTPPREPVAIPRGTPLHGQQSEESSNRVEQSNEHAPSTPRQRMSKTFGTPFGTPESNKSTQLPNSHGRSSVSSLNASPESETVGQNTEFRDSSKISETVGQPRIPQNILIMFDDEKRAPDNEQERHSLQDSPGSGDRVQRNLQTAFNSAAHISQQLFSQPENQKTQQARDPFPLGSLSSVVTQVPLNSLHSIPDLPKFNGEQKIQDGGGGQKTGQKKRPVERRWSFASQATQDPMDDTSEEEEATEEETTKGVRGKDNQLFRTNYRKNARRGDRTHKKVMQKTSKARRHKKRARQQREGPPRKRKHLGELPKLVLPPTPKQNQGHQKQNAGDGDQGGGGQNNRNQNPHAPNAADKRKGAQGTIPGGSDHATTKPKRGGATQTQDPTSQPLPSSHHQEISDPHFQRVEDPRPPKSQKNESKTNSADERAKRERAALQELSNQKLPENDHSGFPQIRASESFQPMTILSDSESGRIVVEDSDGKLHEVDHIQPLSYENDGQHPDGQGVSFAQITSHSPLPQPAAPKFSNHQSVEYLGSSQSGKCVCPEGRYGAACELTVGQVTENNNTALWIIVSVLSFCFLSALVMAFVCARRKKQRAVLPRF